MQLGGSIVFSHLGWTETTSHCQEEACPKEKASPLPRAFGMQVPLIPLPPLFREGLMLHEGAPYDSQLHETTLAMLKQMNRAIVDLPTL